MQQRIGGAAVAVDINQQAIRHVSRRGKIAPVKHFEIQRIQTRVEPERWNAEFDVVFASTEFARAELWAFLSDVEYLIAVHIFQQAMQREAANLTCDIQRG